MTIACLLRNTVKAVRAATGEVIAANIISEGTVVTTATTLLVRVLRIEAEMIVHGHERRCRQILLNDVDLQIRPVRSRSRITELFRSSD